MKINRNNIDRRPIRIMHIMDKLSKDGSKIHGPARQMLYRLPYYDSNRYNVMICSLRGEDEASRLLRNNGVTVECLSRHKFNPFSIIDLYKIIRSWRPSLLHLHGYASWNFGRILAKLLGVPVVVQEHFIDGTMPLYQKAIDWSLKNVHHKAIAVSEAVKKFMIDERSVRGDIDIVWNGVPIDNFIKINRQDLQRLKQEYGISDDVKIVGIVGRLGGGKGHKYFLDAAKSVLTHYKDVMFLVVGEGPLSDRLKDQTKRLGLKGNVIFTGYQERVFNYLSLLDVSVIASVSEGFPGVGLESFLVGTPLVCTDLPGIQGIYEHNKNVLLVPARDAEALAGAISKILKTPDLADKLAKNGMQVANLCSMKEIAKKYIDCYESLLEVKKG